MSTYGKRCRACQDPAVTVSGLCQYHYDWAQSVLNRGSWRSHLCVACARVGDDVTLCEDGCLRCTSCRQRWLFD